MPDEIFRQSGKKDERAVMQGDDGLTSSERHQGPIVAVDSFRDRFERVEPGERLPAHRTELKRVPDYSSADQLKAEIAEVATLGTLAWELPSWRPAELSREILQRLSDSVNQLKVVMHASDSLGDQVEALFQPENMMVAADAEEITGETNGE